MARRTKEAAAETRASLLDAAEQLFLQQGVSGTSLAQIASAAGATRGAIYWHFKDKSDLFNAMVDRVSLPFQASIDELVHEEDPVQALRDHVLATMKLLASDPQLQRVLTVATTMVELVDAHSPIRQRHELGAERFTNRVTQCIRLRMEHDKRVTQATPEQLGIAFHSLVYGMMNLWLLQPNFDLQATCQVALDAFLRGAGLEVREAPASNQR